MPRTLKKSNQLYIPDEQILLIQSQTRNPTSVPRIQMEAATITNTKTQKTNNSKKNKPNDALKVVYISSPMKVKTSPSNFRSLVQQLTGKNSDISQYMEDGDAFSNFREFDCDDGRAATRNQNRNQNHQTVSSISPADTPSSSDSFLDDVFVPEMEDQFAGFFASELLQINFDF